MDTFLWIVSSLVMAGLLVLLGVRAVKELLLPEKHTLPVSRERLSPERWPWPVLFFGSLAVLWLGTFMAYAAVSGGAEGFFAHFFRRFTEAGDGPHYLFIAENGYVSDGNNVNNIVFYPLYPLLTRLLSILLGGRTALAGMILSQVCYGLSAVVMAKLAERTCDHPGYAMASYMLYPFGFFCLGVFTEGLFLLLSLLGLYLIRERKWLWAGLVSFLCALCRTQGVLLLLPGIYMVWRQYREEGRKWKYLSVLGSVLGFFVYLCINKIVCGEFFAYQYYESIAPWWQTPQWLGATIAQQWAMGLEHPDLANWIYWPQLFLYFIAAALLLAGWRSRLDMPYILYGTAYLGMCYTASRLISGCRYMLGCVPVFLCVGQIKNRGLRAFILLAELVFFGMYYYWYAQGQAIM